MSVFLATFNNSTVGNKNVLLWVFLYVGGSVLDGLVGGSVLVGLVVRSVLDGLVGEYTG